MADTITLYHYTTPRGAEGIQNTKRINKAVLHPGYGEGVYFSEYLVGENITREQMAHLNYAQTGDALQKMNQGYIDYVVAVTFRRNVVTPAPTDPTRGVWFYPTDSHLDLTPDSVIEWRVSAVHE